MTDVTYLALRFQSHFWTTSIIYYGIMDHLPEDYQYPLAYTTLGAKIQTDSLNYALTLQIAPAIESVIKEIDNVIFISIEPKSTGQMGDILFGVANIEGEANGIIADFPGDGMGGDVWLQRSYVDLYVQNNTAAPVPAPGSDVFGTIIHEIGHAMGLDHPNLDGRAPGYDVHFTMMSYNQYSSTAGVYPRTPMVLDIAALQTVSSYGANFGYRTGNDSYPLLEWGTSPFLATIWDGGGNDTIDGVIAPGAPGAHGVEIDLRPGHYSSLYADDHLGVALVSHLPAADQLKALIECARSGTGEDTLVGNRADNTIWAGGGDDVIYINGEWNDDHDAAPNNDTIDALGADSVYAGDGNDVIYGARSDGGTLEGDAGDELWGEGGNDSIHGGAMADIIVGGPDDDKIWSGGGNDTIYGCDGNDTVYGWFEEVIPERGTIVFHGGNELSGGRYYDVLDCGRAAGGQGGAGGGSAPIAPPAGEGERLEINLDGDGVHVSLAGGDSELEFIIDDVATVRSDQPYHLTGGAFGTEHLHGLELLDHVEEDGGDGEENEVDLSGAAEDLQVDVRSWTAQTIQLKDDNDVKLKLAHADIVRTGAGDDVIYGGGKHDDRLTEIDSGAGNDEFKRLMPGTIVNTGTGDDTVNFGNIVLYADLGADDVIEWGGIKLTGAVRWRASEQPVAEWGPLRMGFNEAGELCIIDPAGNTTYIADADVGPDAAPGDRTAGLLVFTNTYEAYLLLDPAKPRSVGDMQAETFETLAATFKALYGFGQYQGVDPLVLDLDGDGIELTAMSSISPRFDFDGDRFAEPAGWVATGDGFLVRDINANGQIDDVGEMFGNATISGFEALAAFDNNSDGRIDTADPIFAELRVWQDADRDGITDPGELQTLTELGLAAISLASHAPAQGSVARNQIDAEADLIHSDGSISTAADVRFRIDNFHTVYLGDTSVSPEAAALPDLRGRGTLADLRVAMTERPDLLQTVADVLPQLNMIDLAGLREAAQPILSAWAEVGGSGGDSIPVKILAQGSGNRVVTDFGIPAGDGALASGRPVVDADGHVIASPTFADIVAMFDREGDYIVIDGADIGFVERHLGEDIPFEHVAPGSYEAIEAAKDAFDLIDERIDITVVRLAVQGPLRDPFFQGIRYDIETDRFHPTTDRQLVPVFEAIFSHATGDPEIYLGDWREILDIIIGDYDRGASYLINSYGFLFGNIVAAAKSVGWQHDIVETAAALGIPEQMIRTGTGTLTGNTENDLFYLNDGDQTARGGLGHDEYVVVRNFGHDVIEDFEPPLLVHMIDTLRFADIRSTEVTAWREGLDLIIGVNGSDDQVRVVRQFEGEVPDLFGNDASEETGVTEVVFADGVVWGQLEMARQVSRSYPGNEEYLGTGSVDFLDGGPGDDFLSGSDDSDVYRFGPGDGHDVIFEDANYVLLNRPDMLLLEGDITSDDILYRREADSFDLEIVLPSGDSVLIRDQFKPMYTGLFEAFWLNRVELVQFPDGQSDDYEWIMERMVAEAKTPGNDTIYGFCYHDTLDGGAGDDLLIGGNDEDTYVFRRGYGSDTIDDRLNNILSGESDCVRFKGGISLDDIVLQREGESPDLRIELLGSDDSLTIKGQFDLFVLGPFGVRSWSQIERFDFSDGVSLSAVELKDRILELAKTPGDDLIYGFSYPDRMDGGMGNDTLIGGRDSDTYVFDIGYGQDVIEDWSQYLLFDDVDRVEFGAGIAPSDVSFSCEDNDLVIHLVGHEDTLTIRRYFEADVIGNRTYEVEELHFADGTVLTDADIRGLRFNGTAGDDTLVGADGDDTFDGGAGDDRMEGRNGSDIYLFAPGYGMDTVLDEEAISFLDASDAVVFSPAILVETISLSRSGSDLNDLVATYVPTGERITIERQFMVDGLGHPFDQVEELRFADGATWSAADIRAMLLQGTPGNDTLVGFYSPDTYAFGYGHGQDTIRDPAISPLIDDGDRVAFASDIAPANIRLSHIGENLVFDIVGTSDRLTIEDQFFTDGLGNHLHEIETFVFADGTVWTVPEIQQMLLQSTAGNDTLLGFSSPDTLDGGAGDDWLEGRDGADVYAFDVGYGHDRILDLDTALGEQTDVILLGAGLTVGNVHLARVGDDLVLWAPGITDTLTIHGYFYGGALGRPYEIEEVRFSDATTWHHDDILAIVTEGSANNDTILGDSGANTLDGGAGNDQLLGVAGGDTYVFALGYGNDTIFDDPGSTSYLTPDHLQLGPGITTSNIELVRYGDDLEIGIVGSVDRLLIDEQFNTDNLGNRRFEIEQVTFADGTVWARADVQTILLQGTDGDDTIIGFYSSDTLDGGLGNDSLDGGNARDTYVFGRSYGHDTI